MDRKEFIKNYVNQTGENQYNHVTLLKGLHYDKIQKRLYEINRQKDKNGDYIFQTDSVGLVDYLQVDGPNLFPFVLYSEDEKHINYTETLIKLMIEIENNSNDEFIIKENKDLKERFNIKAEAATLFRIEEFDYDGVTPMLNNLYKADKITEYLKWKHHQVGIYPPEIK